MSDVMCTLYYFELAYHLSLSLSLSVCVCVSLSLLTSFILLFIYLFIIYFPFFHGHSFLRLSVWRGLLISLFFNTLFFEIYYPENTCAAYTTKLLCLSTPDMLDKSTTQCLWKPDASVQCVLNPPPSSVTFSLLVSLIVMILSIIFNIPFGYVHDEFASSRPALEVMGLSSHAWLGTDAPDVYLKVMTEAAKYLPQHHSEDLFTDVTATYKLCKSVDEEVYELMLAPSNSGLKHRCTEITSFINS